MGAAIYTCHLLVRLKHRLAAEPATAGTQSYGDIGHAVFGLAGRRLVESFVVLQQLGPPPPHHAPHAHAKTHTHTHTLTNPDPYVARTPTAFSSSCDSSSRRPAAAIRPDTGAGVVLP